MHVTTVTSRSRTCVILAAQVLLYPAMQALTLDLPSMVSNEQYAFHFLSRRAVAQYYSMYIGEYSCT